MTNTCDALVQFGESTHAQLVSHLHDRRLDITLHRPVISVEDTVVTFFLWNISGQLVGYQQYRPSGSKKHNNPRSGRYFTYKTPGTVAVWGIESLCFAGPVFVCEGIFDAARLTELGKPAIAVLSSNPDSSTCNFLSCLGRPTIAVCDNDTAGKQLAKYTTASIIVPEGDLGSATQDFVDYLCTNAISILRCTT